MKASSDLRNENVSLVKLHQSLRNRPSRLLYQPPAKRFGEKQVKSTTPTVPKFQSSRPQIHLKNVCLPKQSEIKSKELHLGCSKPDKQQEHSGSSPSDLHLQLEEDVAYTRLKLSESERKPGLGRGSLLKMQVLYERNYKKANNINEEIENEDGVIKEEVTLESNLDETVDCNGNNNNNNNLLKPFSITTLQPERPSPLINNDEASQKLLDDFPDENQNSKREESVVSSPVEVYTQTHDTEWKMEDGQVENNANLLVNGNLEPEANGSNPLVSEILLPFAKRRNPLDQSDPSLVSGLGLPSSKNDLKENNEKFYNCKQNFRDDDCSDVVSSQSSSLSDETYLTVSSHLSDGEENPENTSKSTDGCDQDSLLSESNTWTDLPFEDSSNDNVCLSFENSFENRHGPNANRGNPGGGGHLRFQEKKPEEKAKDPRISRAAINDSPLLQNKTFIKNPSDKKYPLRCEQRPTVSTNANRYQRSNIRSNCSTRHSPCCSPPKCFQMKAPLYPCPSGVSYQPLSPLAAKLSILQSYGMNASREFRKQISWLQAEPKSNPCLSETRQTDYTNKSLSPQIKEINLCSTDRWKQSALQYKQIFGDDEFSHSWKTTYKKNCSKAGHKFLDTHCHIDMMFNEHLDRIYATFKEYREAHADSFPDEFGGCVAIFCNPLTFNPLGSLFRSLISEPNVWIAVGCHPKKVKFLNNRTFQQLNECIQMPEVVAVGEIGLDYSGIFYLEAEKQKEVFRNQIKLALNVSKPIVIHCRDAEDDCFSILKEECPLDWPIHLHCYMLEFKHAQKWLDTFPNLYIGLTPKVTYRNAFDVHDTAQKIPLSRLVLESDAPYFIPHMVPQKQLKCSHPGLVFTVAETVARLQGRDVKEVLKACWDNSHRLYKINSKS